MENQKKSFIPAIPKLPAKGSMPGKLADKTKFNHHVEHHLDANGNWKPELVALGLKRMKKFMG